VPRPSRVAISVGRAIAPVAGESVDAFNRRLAEALANEVEMARDLRRQ
jgi:hypothetical protein